MDDNGFIRKEKDNKKYCPKCWNKDRKLSIMPNHGIKEFDGINEYAFECPACGYIVYSKDNFTNTTKNDTQPKQLSAAQIKYSFINFNNFTIFEREFHVAFENGDFFY